MNEKYVYIIGAGISGIVAAYELEKEGYSPIILEGTDAIGGRIKTDVVDGFRLDRGFQVLLTAYPEAKKYLDFEQLKLRYFDPGAIILKPGETFIVSDPIRRPTKIIQMAFSKVGNILDKIRIYQLTKELKLKSEEHIFSEPSIPTYSYLKQRGFSERMITNFFKPFFKGIFLEENLETSSRMFEFIFKMFSLGLAAVPEMGMQEIPKQLMSRLNRTQLRLNTKVKTVSHKKITLENGEELSADGIILATEPGCLFPGMGRTIVENHSVVNIYFTLTNSFFAQAKIGLVPDEKFLINNLVFMTDISPTYSADGRALLSISIVKDVSNESNLEKKIALELEALSGINAEFFIPLKTYTIENAIPKVDLPKYSIPAVQTKQYDGIYLAGDYLLNGSINAAMISGRKAAEALVQGFRSPNFTG